MPTVIAIDPITRLEGHLRVEVTVDTVAGKNQVTKAQVSGTSFRGFEIMLANRDPREATQLTQRICGVCPVPHGMAASLALEKTANQTVPANARLLRNLVLGVNFMQSHLLHFYHLSLMDFMGGPAASPWLPEWKVDRRLSTPDNERLIEHYRQALKIVRQIQEMGAIFAGRMPHPPVFVAGGFSMSPSLDNVRRFKQYLSGITEFIRNTYLPDVEFLASQYPEYRQLGRGPGNLLVFGVFDLDSTGEKKLFNAGRVVNGNTDVKPLNLEAITEQVATSWYDNTTATLPPAKGITQPQFPKESAYSWIKAPRYENSTYETGPLARMWINGAYRKGVSVMDRHLARAQETLKIAETLPGWLDSIKMGQPVHQPFTLPASAESAGITEAPRGALGHWLRIENRKIANYQVITPTCWNASPRDVSGKAGPMEEALVGIPVSDTNQPVEVLRVIHSFDPCLACAVHVSRPQSKESVRVIC